MNDKLPVSMHPRYNEFLRFMENCPYRKTPSTMETAFWAWLSLKEQIFEDKFALNLLIEQRDTRIKRLENQLAQYTCVLGKKKNGK